MLAEGFGLQGRHFAGGLHSRLGRIDREYDANARRLRCTDASVADVARDVRRLSTKVGGMQVR